MSGSHADFTDTPIATESEHVDAVLMFRDLAKFLENEAVGTNDRQQWITPFTQVE
jgi:hypothetical protein